MILADAGIGSNGCYAKDVIGFAANPCGAPPNIAATMQPGGLAMQNSFAVADNSPTLRSDWSRSESRSNSQSSRSSRGSRCSPKREQASSSTAAADVTEVLQLGNDGVALLSSPRLLEKIIRTSEARVALMPNGILQTTGTPMQCRRAKKYAGIVTSPRFGPHFVAHDLDDEDLTVLTIPMDVVGYVQGRDGSVLQRIEDEWCTIMMFVDTDLSRPQRLAIFGTVRGRRGSELKVLSAAETKSPGLFHSIRDEVIYRDVYKDDSGSWGTDMMTFKGEAETGDKMGEISYALGKQGSTRQKLQRSSGCIVQYVGMVAVCSGTRAERTRAREYMKWLFQQLEGPVYVDDWQVRDDCTVMDIPSDCIGYITGNKRATLSIIEEEWGTLMFFMSEAHEKGRGRGSSEMLAIFGPERARRGSELKVMSGIETKSPGFFTRGLREKRSEKPGFATDRLVFRDDELSYALGKEGVTRKKLENASGAILQYVGNFAFIAGNLVERRRCTEFIHWLLQQRRGIVTIGDLSQRSDVTEAHIPAQCKGWVTGNRGSELRRIEQASATYMFIALDASGEERLLIFGHNEGTKTGESGRLYAERLVQELLQEKLRGGDGYRRGRQRSRTRSRSRSDSRRSHRRTRAWRG